MDLSKYYQPSPDINEGIPDRIDRSASLFKNKQAIIEMLPNVGWGILDFPKVLDIGPACGWETRQLVERYGSGETVMAITIFGEEAREIRANAPGAAVERVDMHGMPAEWTGKFEIVFASHVLEHSPAPYIALCEIFRVMEAQGQLMIVLPNADGYTGLQRPKPTRLGNMKAHLFMPSIETMIEIARHAGFAFKSYQEVPQACDGQVHYINRIFMLEKP